MTLYKLQHKRFYTNGSKGTSYKQLMAVIYNHRKVNYHWSKHKVATTAYYDCINYSIKLFNPVANVKENIRLKFTIAER
jgi:hypothetical protein